MYADDLLLMSISVSELQLMIDRCVNEFEKLDLLINIKKSVCMRIGSRRLAPVSDMLVNNQPLLWKSELRYLGVTFTSGYHLKCNLQTMRQKYFKALNGIFGKVGVKSSIAVSLSLINSFCVPLLIYGLDAIKLAKSGYSGLEAAYTAAFAKIFGSYDRSIILNCQFFCNYMPMIYRIDLKRMNFLYGLQKLNFSMQMLYCRFGRIDLCDLLVKYGIAFTDSMFCWRSKFWLHFEKSVSV